MRHNVTGKNGMTRIPGFSNIDGFNHYITTSPTFFLPHLGGEDKRGVVENRIIRVRQTHGDNILIINQDIKEWDLFINSGIFDNGYDALITNQKGVILEIRTADCLPMLIIDPNNRIIAAVHAGWRGSLLNLAKKAVNKMKELFGSNEEDLFIGFGPSIGPCCYEVGSDVLRPARKRYPEWTDIIEERGEGKGMFNLQEFNKRQLVALGVRNDRIFSANLCTSCNPDLFPSYRRDGKVDMNIYSGIMIEKEGPF